MRDPQETYPDEIEQELVDEKLQNAVELCMEYIADPKEDMKFFIESLQDINDEIKELRNAKNQISDSDEAWLEEKLERLGGGI